VTAGDDIQNLTEPLPRAVATSALTDSDPRTCAPSSPAGRDRPSRRAGIRYGHRLGLGLLASWYATENERGAEVDSQG
jgi:hypothetical protein